MSIEVPFDKSEKCDICGKEGAFDFMGDFICGECFKTNEEVMKTAEEIERPRLEDFYPEGTNIKTIQSAFIENIELYNYINALDLYIDELVSKQSIIGLIDEMIEDKKLKHQDSDWESEILALTELKEKILKESE